MNIIARHLDYALPARAIRLRIHNPPKRLFIRTMATSIKPEDVSTVAKEEGGTTKGSTSAKMQSQMTKELNENTGASPGTQSASAKQANFEDVAAKVGSKMEQNPGGVTAEDANTLESREHRAGGIRPPTDSLSAEAKRTASTNEKVAAGVGTSNFTGTTQSSAQQSALDKEANFQDAAAIVGSKITDNPRSVTEDDAALLHSREQRAHGRTGKGGIAAQAERLAAENTGATKD